MHVGVQRELAIVLAEIAEGADAQHETIGGHFREVLLGGDNSVQPARHGSS